MGKWFPGFRPATREQQRAYRDAHQALFRNARYEEAVGIREETPHYLNLNDRAWASCAPLSRTQQWWHWRRALTREERDMDRLQKASDHQGRQRRRRSR